MKTSISGKVIQGKGKGKKLGFPTINIELSEKIESGIYAGLTQVGGKNYKAGIFIGENKKILEAHLIDFSGDLYDEEIEVEIQKKLREIKKFKNDGELKKQIGKDIEMVMNNFLLR